MPAPHTSHILTLLVLVTSLLATYFMWSNAQQSARQKLVTEFDYQSEEVISHIQQRMDAYQKILRGIQAMFNGTGNVTRNDFRNYVNTLRLYENFPGIHGIGYSELVRHADKEQHIAAVRAQGYPDYTITPPGDRELYTPVVYIEPFTGNNRKAFGYDTHSEPVRRDALLKARDNDRATLTGKLTLVQESGEDKQAGFLLFLPLYAQGIPYTNVTERRAGIYGWISAVFRMDDLMAGLGHGHPEEVGIYIYDGDTASDSTLMFDSHDSAPTHSTAEFVTTRRIDINGHVWTAVLKSTPAYEARLGNNLPLLVGITGIAFSLLLTLLAHALVRSKQMTADLAESEERWRYALEGAGDGVWDWDMKTNQVNFSRRWKEILGYREEEVGSSISECMDRVHPNDIGPMLENIQAYIDGNSSTFVNEHRSKHKDGSWRWVLDRGIVTSRTENGEPLRMIGTYTDITEIKKAEDELREHRDLTNAVVEGAGNVIVVLDLSGCFVYFNRAAEILTGHKRDKLIGKPVWDWVIPDEQQAGVKQVFNDLRAGNTDLAHRYENDWLTRDGRRTLDWHNTILKNSNGEVTHIVALGYDITERKKSENKIKRLTRLYSTLSHCDQAIVHSANKEELFTQICMDAVSHGGFKMAWIGLTDKKTLAVKPVASYGSCTDYLHEITITVDPDDPTGNGPTGTAIRENHPVWCQDSTRDRITTPWHEHCVTYGLKSSAALPLCINGDTIGAFNLYAGDTGAFDEDSRELLIQMATDINFALDNFAQEEQRRNAEAELGRLNESLETIVKERTDELRQAKEIADAASKAKSDFLSNMSHEIRTPLTSIIGFSEALLSNTFEPTERDKLIQTIVRNGKHLQNIISDILDLSKIEADQLEHELADTSLFTIMGEIQSLIGPGARDKGLEFSINYQFPLPRTITTEPIYLKQILINLCSNASKFTSKGYVHIDVSCDESFRNIRIEVSDSGIGMTPKEVDRVFDPFIQADSTTTREYGGTGLGLAISSRLASVIGGSLGCVSEPGKGSCFTLEFLNRATDQIYSVNSLEEVQQQVDTSLEQAKVKPLSGHILLVEDSPDNQQLIAMYIRKTGAYLDIAADGKAGVDMALNNNYDLILMDMQMPVLDGLEAISRLRNSNYKGPIVSLTANAMLSNRENCLAAGANDYLVKPIDLAQFYEVLNRYLHGDSTDSKAAPAGQGIFDDYYNSPGYLEIVERFRKKLPNMVAELTEAVRKEDWNDVKDKSHDLKGIGGAVQLPEITEVAGRMNIQVINKQYELVATTSAELNSLYKKILGNENQASLVH